MFTPIRLLIYCSVFSMLIFNPAACSRACKGSAHTGEEGLHGCHCRNEKIPDETKIGEEGLNGCNCRNKNKSEDVDDVHVTPGAGEDIKNVPEGEAESIDETNKPDQKTVSQGMGGKYEYEDGLVDFYAIPFKPTDNVYLKEELSKEQATYLMEKGVKFVYSNDAYLMQKDKKFRVIYLMTDDIEKLKTLYEIDDASAKTLVANFQTSINNDVILKASSIEEMITMQNEILDQDEIPVLIFHNSASKNMKGVFAKESNVITCNSFLLEPSSYMVSTDLLDMMTIIKAVNTSWNQSNLQDFYRQFTSSYYKGMYSKKQQQTLIYLAGAAGVTGGITTIVYYNKKT